MDRLTTGRRHVRAGSVTVTELLTKQAAPPLCSSSSPDPREPVTETIPVVPATHRRSPATGAQLAKLASLGVATAVLCGAIGIATTVAQQRREQATAGRPLVEITGEQALLPDKLDPTVPEHSSQGEAAVPAPAPPADDAAVTDDAGPAAPAAPATPENTEPEEHTTASAGSGEDQARPESDLELVRAFYAALPGTPTNAFGLISSDVLGTSLGEFLQSWSTVREIEELDVVEHADGVLARVRIRLLDGSHLRLQQLFGIGGSPRRIIGVQLLSAQRN